ncbi:hypothetical protein BDK92_6484 [Micromonospora pisi]|uniref:Peptidase inhibitor family I36 n=1 Tax=Micromonospora pisi TaxID=589240 RepID=A0A495JUR5_9ACTN|nr:DUF6289 family protein [Micromonospora pisi]RKR92052.1 hypothetical protein BDK92_6484 [Micromonospora pisi]
MPRRKLMLRRTFAMVAAAAGVATALVGPASPAQAIPVCKAGYQCTYIYYSSATFETVVGGRTRFCDGTTDSFGITTRWLELASAQCPEPL